MRMGRAKGKCKANRGLKGKFSRRFIKFLKTRKKGKDGRLYIYIRHLIYAFEEVEIHA